MKEDARRGNNEPLRPSAKTKSAIIMFFMENLFCVKKKYISYFEDKYSLPFRLNHFLLDLGFIHVSTHALAHALVLKSFLTFGRFV